MSPELSAVREAYMEKALRAYNGAIEARLVMLCGAGAEDVELEVHAWGTVILCMGVVCGTVPIPSSRSRGRNG